MPERDTDNNRSWMIPTVFPGADYRLNQAAVAQPQLVEAIGTDGRFVGAIRPFPGMADETVHNIPCPEAGHSIVAIVNIVFAKYVSVQKGLTSDKLSGIAMIGNRSGGPPHKALYFAYYDSSDGSSDVVQLEDFKDWDDFDLETYPEIDIISKGQYIYLVVSGDTSSVDSNYSTKEPPYNKAYYWDWQINSWDVSTDAWATRLMGIAAPRFLTHPLNQDIHKLVVAGTKAETTDANNVIDLTADTPDLSGVTVGDFLYLQEGGHELESDITVVNDAGDLLTVTDAPNWSSGSGIVSWRVTKEVSTKGSDVYNATLDVLVGFTMPVGWYTLGVELISRKHRLRSHLRLYTKHATGVADTELTFSIRSYNPVYGPVGAGNAAQLYNHRGVGTGAAATCMLAWGIPHADGFRLWRSTGDGAAASALRDKYAPVGRLYLIDPYIDFGVKLSPSSTSASGVMARIDHAPADLGLFPVLHRSTYYHDGRPPTEVETSGALQARPAYDAWDEPFGPAPRMKRIAAYSGLLVGITDSVTPTDFENWDETDNRPEELCWSHTSRNEPENFPVFNRYSLEGAGETFLGFEPAGDHLFVLTRSSIHKVLRSGSVVTLNQVLSRIGVVNRFAATGVGNTLFVVTTAGVKSIDGNSGAVKSISALDRIMIQEGEWGSSLDAVHLEYDATTGALVFLNTTKKECIFLWESTGAVTKLVDAPWTFLTAGPDVATSGTQRVYFVMADGEIHVVDADREMGKRSMCGTGAAETANGTCTTGSITQIIDTEAAFPTNCLGHKVYILNGEDAGVATTITTRNSGTVLTVSGLTVSTDTDTRYAVAPIVTELVFPQLAGYRGEHDPFTRKVTRSMSAAFSGLGGETDPDTDVNAKLRFGVWRDGSRLLEQEADINVLPDKCLAHVSVGDARVYPSLRFLSGNIDFELQALMVEGIISGNAAQSRIT